MEAKFEGEHFSELLDRVLYKQGHGSADQLARQLESIDGLNARQIARKVSAFRGDPDGARTFDLALSIAVAMPELLAAMAQRAGCLLVAKPEADPRAAAARVAQSSGNVLSVFLMALADGEITPAERAEIRKAATAAERDIEGLSAQADASAGEVR